MTGQSIKAICYNLILLLSLQYGFSQQTTTVDLPSSYNFDYIYKLKITHKKEHTNLDYYLNSGSTYFGFDSPEMSKGSSGTKMFMVMDNELNITAMFMEMMGKKMVQKSTLLNPNYVAAATVDDKDSSEFKFEQIGSKSILGYECEGYVTENNEMKITYYITDDVPVSFNQVWGASAKNLPKGFNPELMKKYAENGLMLEMIYVDKKKSKNSMTMECIALEKTDFSIDTSQYGSMMSALGGGN